MNVRRLPGFVYNYKLATVLLVSSLFLVIYLLLHWGIMCTNFEAWRHVSNVVSPTTTSSQSRSSTTIGDEHDTRRARSRRFHDSAMGVHTTGVYRDGRGASESCAGRMRERERGVERERTKRTHAYYDAASPNNRGKLQPRRIFHASRGCMRHLKRHLHLWLFESSCAFSLLHAKWRIVKPAAEFGGRLKRDLVIYLL